ncbi:phosphate ABC transporter permease subunit PstC [Iodidimonas gelatinilytica]|uniref:phosphate ABC transporter permease subunit PstC n=1 Tax=Iodidimonas gelatinilytica TaxID=1236966 RepID=UPI001B2FECB6|nr:phosphate ABC transporter permease subunit PstC [Iodidimonas gelatinilytica]
MSRRSADRFLSIGLMAAGLLSGVLLLFIVLFISMESWPVLNHTSLSTLLTSTDWRPSMGRFGLLAILVGSLSVSFLALLLAAPLGLATAFYLSVYAPPKIAAFGQKLIEVMAGIPSVVFGLWGLVTLVPIMVHLSPPGTSMLTAGIVLAIMIAPTLTVFSLLAIKSVPMATVQSGRALGLGRGTILRTIILPQARPGIVTGTLLALARALGETMAVMMVAGNVVHIPASLLDPVRTLTANIALEMGYALDAHRSALFMSGLLVMLITLIIVMAAGFKSDGTDKAP